MVRVGPHAAAPVLVVSARQSTSACPQRWTRPDPDTSREGNPPPPGRTRKLPHSDTRQLSYPPGLQCLQNTAMNASTLADQDLDMSNITVTSSNLSSIASNITTSTDMTYAGSSNTSDSVPDFWLMDNPEEMLMPWVINQHFIPVVITHSVTFLVGVIGNLLVVFVMAGDRKSRTATNLFLVSLSLADLLLLIVFAPLETIQYFVVQWDAGGTVCKMAKYAEILSAVASVLNLTAVSLER